MAIQGRFLADFQSFYDACQKAEVSMRGFDSGANKVESSLNRMADSFSGRKIIQEATLMAAAIEKTGGTTKLTADELEHASRVAEQAATKMKALGIEVPPEIQKLAAATAAAKAEQDKLLDSIGQAGGRLTVLGDSSSRTSGAVGGLMNSYRQFDGALAAVGVNIAPQVKGLAEVAAAATAGAGAIGAFGTAGIVAATAIGAFKIGRMVSEFLELDGAVQKAWQTLLGYADTVAETAGAKQDVINLAIANGAKESITYEQAIRKLNDASIDWTSKLAAAHREVRNLGDAQIRDIQIAKEAGATTEQLTNKYNVSSLALKLLADRQQLAAAAADAHTKKLEEQRRASEELDRQYNKLKSEIKNEAGIAQMQSDRAAMEWIAAQVKATAEAKIKGVRDTAAAEAEAEAARITANQRQIDAMQKELDALLTLKNKTNEVGEAAKNSTDQATKGFARVAQQVTVTGDAIRAWLDLMRYSAQVNAVLSENSLFTTQSQRDRIANISLPTLRSTDIGRTGGGSVSNTFNIVDTEANLARRVADEIMRSIRSGGQLSA